MNPYVLYLFVISLFLWSCSYDSIEQKSEYYSIHFGTYLYQDEDCSGDDIQYATFDSKGITFFDYLGDNCDDTTECYSMDTYELTEITQDSFLIVLDNVNTIPDGLININEDSTMVVSYSRDSGPEEYKWDKISEDILSFTPTCEEEYPYTKDIADMLVYAVSDGGDLLWKNPD